MRYIDYSKEKYNIYDEVSFNVKGTEIVGEGTIIGFASTGLVKTWNVFIDKDKGSEYVKNLPELAIIVQECFLVKH